MRLRVPPPAYLRALSLLSFSAVLVQLFILSEPPLVITLKSFLWDKSLHAAAFGAFAALLWTGVGFRAPLLNWIAVTGVGVLDEIHQIWIPTRSADILDVAADALGAAIVTFILHRLAYPPVRESVRLKVCAETGD